MSVEMQKNLQLTIVNMLIIGVPIFLILGGEAYIFSILLQVVLIALLFWNTVGDFFVLHTVFHGKGIPQNAEMSTALDRYKEYLASNNHFETSDRIRILHTNSNLPFFLPISNKTFVVSSAMQDALISEGAELLIRRYPKESYNQAELLSRKCLLLTIIGYKLTLRFLEFWAVIFLFACKALASIIMLLVTGALFGSAQEILNALAWGSFLGDLLNKANNLVNYIQDKLVAFLVREAVIGHINSAIK